MPVPVWGAPSSGPGHRPGHPVERQPQDRLLDRHPDRLVEVERPDQVLLAPVAASHRRRRARGRARVVIVVAHHEDPVCAGQRRGGRHRRPPDVGRRGDRHLRLRVGLHQGRPDLPDERAVGRDERVVDDLDVDVDPIDAELAGEVDQPAGDLRPAGLGGRTGTEQALVASLAEAGEDELDPGMAVMGLADQLLADRAGDLLVAALARVERSVRPVRHREQGERREVGPGDVGGDRVVHLPVREEAVDLVTGGRDRGRLGRVRRHAGIARPTARRRGARTGRRLSRRARPERSAQHESHDDHHRDEHAEGGQGPLAPGHGGRVGAPAGSVKRSR